MSADNPFADLQWQLGYCLTPNSTVTIQGEKKKLHKDKITQKVFKRKI